MKAVNRQSGIPDLTSRQYSASFPSVCCLLVLIPLRNNLLPTPHILSHPNGNMTEDEDAFL